MAPDFSTSGLSDALVILAAAGIVIPAFARFRVSPVIGFILIGLLVGPYGLGGMAGEWPWLHYVTISNVHVVEPFAEFGIILLLFTIGLELSFRRLWGMRSLVFGAGAAEVIGSALLLGLGLRLVGYGWPAALALGFALALSSTALVLPLVNRASPVGRSALGMLLFEDVAIVPIIFALGALAPRGGDGAVDSLLSTLLWGTVTVGLMLLAGRLLLPRLFAQAARTKSPELFLSISLLTVMTASLATSAVGLSPIVGALIAGVLIAETEYRGEVEAMMSPFRGLGLGIFLITVGMSVDLRRVAAEWEMVVLALVAVMLVKALVTAGLLRLGGARKSVAAETAVVMASPSETTLIVLAAAAAAGVVAGPDQAFWQMVTALGLTLTPLLAQLGRRFARGMDPEGVRRSDGLHPASGRPRSVIIGYGRVGRLVAEMLALHDRDFVAVDSDIDNVVAARKEGIPIVFGDASRSEFLDSMNLGHASSLVLTMDDPVQTVRLVKKVRAWCPDLTIVARARDAHHAAELYRAGATDAVPETLESSLQLSEAVLVDLGMAVGPVIASIHEKRAELRQQIMEMGDLDREPALRRRTLRESRRGQQGKL